MTLIYPPFESGCLMQLARLAEWLFQPYLNVNSELIMLRYIRWLLYRRMDGSDATMAIPSTNLRPES